METFKDYKKLHALTVFNLVLIILCIFGCLYSIAVSDNFYFVLEAFVEIFALIAAVSYFANGYKKDAAKYYKMFMLIQAATFIVEYVLSSFLKISNDISGASFAISLILYGNTLLLGVAKDLGKKVTISIASFNLAVYVIYFIGTFLVTYESTVEMMDSIIMASTWFTLAGITLLMTFAKYIDKASRNTK